MKKGILIIRAFIRGADEKHAAASKTKGVVGQTGMIRPAAPSTRKKNPKPVSRIVFSRN